MRGARLAEWIMFHRLYVKPYNAFIDVCPAGFKPILNELGILSCERRINRRPMIAFEATEDIARPRKISDQDAYVISAYKHKVIAFIIKVSTVYADFPTNPLEPYEAWLLSDWLGMDVAYYISVKYNENAL